MMIDTPEGWAGFADFNLRVADPGGLEDDQDFRLTVLEPGLPSWAVALEVRNGTGELESLGVGIHTDATDGIDPSLGEVALPPWPPSDVFDARCELPDILTHARLDLRVNSVGNPTYHVVWQVGTGGYPVTVSWPSWLPLGDYIIRDDLGGAFLPPLDMTTTQSLVVPDSLSFITGLVIELDPLIDTTVPVGPTGLDLVDWSAWDWVTVDWSAYPCTEKHFAYYEILFDTIPFFTSATYSWDWSEDIALTNIATSSTTLLLPGPASGYIFRIRAWDTFGNVSDLSDPCSVGDVTGIPNPRAGETLMRASSCTPNPFNPETSIFLELEDGAKVRAEIFDVRGHRVRLLLDELLSAGEHILTWNGQDEGGRSLASGYYECRISGGGEHLSRRMMLLK